MFHPGKKKLPSIQMETQKRGHGKKSREVNASGNDGNPSLPGIPAFTGDRASCPREDTLRRSPIAEFDGSAPSFAGDTEGCCVVQQWSGRAGSRGGHASRRLAEHTKTE